MTGKNPHFIPTHHFELCQGSGNNLLVNSHSNCFINPGDQVKLSNWNFKCKFTSKSSFSSINVFKNFLKQTLVSLLQTTFDMECPCT